MVISYFIKQKSTDFISEGLKMGVCNIFCVFPGGSPGHSGFGKCKENYVYVECDFMTNYQRARHNIWIECIKNV